jgi:hypothetical protein
MKKNPLNKGVLTSNGAGIGPVTREMLQTRARELALIAGRTPPLVTQADYELAKREMNGEPEEDRQEAILDAIPESERWDPVPGSTGHQIPESPSEDEDDEGRSETEQLVDEGVNEAERDRMLQAARATEKSDHRET